MRLFEFSQLRATTTAINSNYIKLGPISKAVFLEFSKAFYVIFDTTLFIATKYESVSLRKRNARRYVTADSEEGIPLVFKMKDFVALGQSNK